MPKSFIAKQEDHKEWMEEEETSKDEELNVKGLFSHINDFPNGNLNMCDVDTSLAIQELDRNLENTWFPDSRYTKHMTILKSFLTYFFKKDGPIVVFGDNNEEAVMGIGGFECRAFKLKDVLRIEGIKRNLISISQHCHIVYKVLIDLHEGNVF